MRLLYCIPDFGHGGAERQLAYLAAEMARAGHEVHVASCRGGHNLERMRSAGVVWHPLIRNHRGIKFLLSRIRLVRAPLIFFRLLLLMRRLRPDVVQTVLAPMDMLGGAAALLTRTPWILKESSCSLMYTTYRQYWFRSAFGRLADAVVANSVGGYEYWRPMFKNRPLHLIPNGLPLEELAKTDALTVSDLTFRPNQKVIVFAGRLDIGKNVESAIAALARIADDVPFVFIICGDGSHRRRVQRQASKLGIAHRVIVAGYVDYVWQLLKRADAFVSMSRCEGRPNVVLEAMACGCPIVASEIPAHREILDDETAFFARLDDVESASQVMKRALTDVDAARARAAAAQARIADSTVEKMARLYEQVYRDVAAYADLLTERVEEA